MILRGSNAGESKCIANTLIGHVLGVFCVLCPVSAHALSVLSAGSIAPFDINLASGQAIAGLVLTVVNDDGIVDTVLSWQLDLRFVPLGSAVGGLTFTSVVAPQDSLFGPDPGPTSLETLPSSRVHVFDADYSNDFSGMPVSPNEARSIVQLDVAADSTTSGDFQLLMKDFDSENTDDGSSWFPTDTPDPIAFSNTTVGNAAATRLLGTIHVSQSIPGDYDGDGSVTVGDFQRWRSRFGASVPVPGAESDGNGDGTVDASDYVIWRQHFVQSSGSSLSGANDVPEPKSAVLLISCASAISGFFSRRRLFSEVDAK